MSSSGRQLLNPSVKLWAPFLKSGLCSLKGVISHPALLLPCWKLSGYSSCGGAVILWTHAVDVSPRGPARGLSLSQGKPSSSSEGEHPLKSQTRVHCGPLCTRLSSHLLPPLAFAILDTSCISNPHTHRLGFLSLSLPISSNNEQEEICVHIFFFFCFSVCDGGNCKFIIIIIIIYYNNNFNIESADAKANKKIHFGTRPHGKWFWSIHVSFKQHWCFWFWIKGYGVEKSQNDMMHSHVNRHSSVNYLNHDVTVLRRSLSCNNW